MMVILSPYVTHRHPVVWPEPLRFDPDRFLPERSADRPRFAWFPFLGGPHQCIGQEFALLEAVLAVAMLVSEFRLEPVPGRRVEAETSLTIRLRGSLPLEVEPA
jgi:cytochrome P450